MFQSLAAVVFIAFFAGAESQLRCQYGNGTMMPSATVCSDQLATCAAIFGTAVTTTSTTRPTNCDLEEMQDVAVRCAKTCGICCETAVYGCLDSTVSPINCSLNSRYCTNANWVSVMSTYCPATCGLCANATCADAISGCPAMVGLCQNINWYSYMTTNCARTCSYCSVTSSVTTTTTTCSNIASNCAANIALCNNSVYYSLMTTNCAATCGRCSSSTSCVNANANCASWVSNGFCSSSFYTTAQKRQYCARSCGLC
uniref:ShKT domain-containing protein n=1 Tax=Panagrellus redivivus TaxID=6233 RepID=A0A7E4W919_PANRE